MCCAPSTDRPDRKEDTGSSPESVSSSSDRRACSPRDDRGSREVDTSPSGAADLCASPDPESSEDGGSAQIQFIDKFVDVPVSVQTDPEIELEVHCVSVGNDRHCCHCRGELGHHGPDEPAVVHH